MPLCRPFERSNTERKITAVPNEKRGAERYCICRDYCNRNVCSRQRVLSKKCSCLKKFFESPTQDVGRIYGFWRIASKSGVYTHGEDCLLSHHGVFGIASKSGVATLRIFARCPRRDSGQIRRVPTCFFRGIPTPFWFLCLRKDRWLFHRGAGVSTVNLLVFSCCVQFDKRKVVFHCTRRTSL